MIRRGFADVGKIVRGNVECGSQMGWWWQVKVAGAMKRREVASEVSFKVASDSVR